MALCIAALAHVSPPGWGAPLSPGEVFKSTREAVHVLESSSDGQAAAAPATALSLGDSRFATTCDVAASGQQVSVVIGDRRQAAKLVLQDPARNLCVFEAAGLSSRRPPGRDSLPEVGERVYAVTNSLGLGLGITEGLISGIRTFGKDQYIQFTAPIAPGAEGGGLFDAQGRLLGVIDYRWRDGQNVNFAAPAKWLDEIGGRHSEDRKRILLREKALLLARQKQWKDLLDATKAWTGAYREDPEAWLWLGAAAEANGDNSLAEKGYGEVRKLDPQSLQGGIGLTRVLWQQKRWPEARETARGLLALRAEDAEVWSAVANSELMLGNLAAAEEAYRKATALAPYYEPAFRGLAEIARRRGDLDTEQYVRRRLADIQPNLPQPQFRLADVYLRRNDPAGALAIVERVAQAHPENADAPYYKAKALIKLERPLAAIAALKRSIEMKPSGPDWVWAALGDIYYDLRMWREAVAAYRKSVELAPDVPEWKGKLAVALKDSAQYPEALKIFQEWTEKYPDDPFGWRQVGFVYGYQNRNAESAKALEHALNIDPKQGKVWLALMEQYHQAGRRDDMRRAYQQLRAVDQEYADRAYRSLILPLEVTQ